MKILFIFSLLTIIITLFPAGILFCFWARKISGSGRGWWVYCKVLLLTALAVFLSVYFITASLSNSFPQKALAFLMLLAFALLSVAITFFFQKDWYKVEKIATISWGLLLFFAILFLSTNFSLFYPFLINDTGMEPIYSKGDLVFCQLNKILIGGYSKGDVVIHSVPSDRKIPMARKIIGVPGDKIEIKNERLFVNNQSEREIKMPDSALLTLEEDQYFVLNENSESNFDSRIFGPIKSDQIYARALFQVNWLK